MAVVYENAGKVHGILRRIDDEYFEFVFPFNGQTIQHVFNKAEICALKTQIDTLIAGSPGGFEPLKFIRG